MTAINGTKIPWVGFPRFELRIYMCISIYECRIMYVRYSGSIPRISESIDTPQGIGGLKD